MSGRGRDAVGGHVQPVDGARRADAQPDHGGLDGACLNRACLNRACLNGARLAYAGRAAVDRVRGPQRHASAQPLGQPVGLADPPAAIRLRLIGGLIGDPALNHAT